MEITIKIDDESRFKDFVDKEIDALTDEEKHDIIIEMIKKYCMNSDTIKSMFVKTSYSTWNRTDTYEPTDILKNLVSKIDITEDVSELREEISKVIREDADKVISNLFIDSIVNLFEESIKNSYSLKNALMINLGEARAQTLKMKEDREI